MLLTGPQKTIAALIISTIGSIVTGLLVALPDNDQVQLWGGIIAGAVTVIATTLGVYQTENKVLGVATQDDTGPWTVATLAQPGEQPSGVCDAAERRDATVTGIAPARDSKGRFADTTPDDVA